MNYYKLLQIRGWYLQCSDGFQNKNKTIINTNFFTSLVLKTENLYIRIYTYIHVLSLFWTQMLKKWKIFVCIFFYLIIDILYCCRLFAWKEYLITTQILFITIFPVIVPADNMDKLQFFHTDIYLMIHNKLLKYKIVGIFFLNMLPV